MRDGTIIDMDSSDMMSTQDILDAVISAAE